MQLPVSRWLLAGAAPLLLGGCVAAVAPIVGGGIFVGKQIKDEVAERRALREGAAAVRAATPAAVPVEGGDPALPGVEPVEARLTDLTELPPPTAADILPQGAAGGSTAYAAFAARAMELAAADPLSARRRSAVLADPASLRPTTRPCGLQRGAVLVDLDPAGALFDAARAQTQAGDAGLAAALANLRAADIEIVWLSGLPWIAEEELRGLLAARGLDPAGADRIALLQTGEDKPAARERALAGRCLQAVLGDDRADFDPLFQYLRRPEAAASLDALLGDVWFLVPTPLQ